MQKVFSVVYVDGRCRIEETSDDGLGLDAWIWRDSRYEYRTVSLEEAIRVALGSCHAVRQQYAGVSVEDLLQSIRACERELDRHASRLERQPWAERLHCLYEELTSRLEGRADGVELSSYRPSLGCDFRGGPWHVMLAKYAYGPKELAATGYAPNDITFVKRLSLVA